ARALRTMLTSSGPANISGNNVSTSTFIEPHTRQSSPWFPLASIGIAAPILLLDNLQRAAQSLLRAASGEQRSNRVDRHALLSNNAPDIFSVEAQFINGQPVALHRIDLHVIRMAHQPFHHIFQESLHALPFRQQARKHSSSTS